MEAAGRYVGGDARAQAPMPEHASLAQDWACSRQRMEERRRELELAREACAIAEREERECWQRLMKCADVAWQVAKDAPPPPRASF